MIAESVLMLITLSLVVFSLVIQGYFMSRMKRLNETNNTDYTIKAVMSEIGRRLERQDRRILDHQIRMDILETKIERETSNVKEKLYKELNTFEGKSHAIRTATSQVSQVQSMKSNLDLTATQVIEFLREGSKSSKEIQLFIGKSREHTSRLMKKLFDDGYVKRDEMKRPYTYQLR